MSAMSDSNVFKLNSSVQRKRLKSKRSYSNFSKSHAAFQNRSAYSKSKQYNYSGGYEHDSQGNINNLRSRFGVDNHDRNNDGFNMPKLNVSKSKGPELTQMIGPNASITSRQSMFDSNKRIEMIIKSSKASIMLIDNLVNDLLDYAKLDNASLVLNMGYFNLSQEIDIAISMMNWNASKRNVAIFTNSKATKYLKSVYGDRVRICRIILNLLSNSIKFTSQNGNVWIEVNVRKTRQSEDEEAKIKHNSHSYRRSPEEIPVKIEIRVKDNG